MANAGIFTFGRPAQDVTTAEWDEVLDVNLKGVWLTVKAAIPHLVAQGNGGSVVITSSTAGRNGLPNAIAYAASKHGVVGVNAVLFLASDEARYVTGTELEVDAGYDLV